MCLKQQVVSCLCTWKKTVSLVTSVWVVLSATAGRTPPNPPALDVLVWVSEAGGRRSRGKEKGNVSSEGEAGLGLIDYLGETHTPPLH